MAKRPVYLPLPTALLLLCIVPPATAVTLNYAYTGNHFEEIQGEPDVFSPDDRVSATFTLDCAIAHAAGDCTNLPYANYLDLGAVTLAPNSFSAGPASLPASDGSAQINEFSFSTGAQAEIVDWNMDLGLEDPSGMINVDTDNIDGGTDSAAALNAFANVLGQPGSWTNDPPPVRDDIDVVVAKSVDNAVPSDPLQTVQFSVVVSNRGSTAASGVVVTDVLSDALAVPEGMAPSATAGDYDLVSGRWEVGELAADETQVLKIPVIIRAEPQPACIVNRAVAAASGDIDTRNNVASVWLERPGVERCIDLGAKITLTDVLTYPCSGQGDIHYNIKVNNTGRDTAYNVVLEISETQFQAPGFSVNNDNCDGLRCTWDSLAAGQSQELYASSDLFKLDKQVTHAITVSIRGDTEDYAPGNNTDTDQITVGPFPTEDCSSGGGFENMNIGGGCMIATAAYGTHTDSRLDILRDFRDRVLARSDAGRAVVAFYYRVSPPIADYIATRPTWRAVVRGLLEPVLFAIRYPVAFVAILGALIAAAVLGLRRRIARPSSPA